MSDLHVDDVFYSHNRNQMQLTDMLDYAAQNRYDALICGGDISSYGDTTKWYEVKAEVDRLTDIPEKLWVLGNHEYGTTGFFTTPPAVQSAFKTFSGYGSIYYHKVINGYHFIVLAAEQSLPTGVLSDAQLTWLSHQLEVAAADSNGKPIFVVSHFDMESGSVYKDVSPLLRQYVNAIFLYGHIHSAAPKNIYEAIEVTDGYTAAHMGSLNYYDESDTADCLDITVYADRVELNVVRTEGPALSPSVRTVRLTGKPAFSAELGEGYADFFSVLPEDYIGKVFIAAVYDNEDDLIGLGFCEDAARIVFLRVWCDTDDADNWSVFIFESGATPLVAKHSGTFG